MRTEKSKKSLIGSIQYQQTIMIRTERVIFVIISVLVVALTYSSASNILAVKERGEINCKQEFPLSEPEGPVECCQAEWDSETPNDWTTYCTECDNTKPPSNCSERYISMREGIQDEPPTPAPFGPAPPLQDGGVLQQPPQTNAPQDDNQGGGLPPIKNQENVPPGGSVAEQPEDDGEQEDSSEGAETAGPLT